jgi:hypothetical protein
MLLSSAQEADGCGRAKWQSFVRKRKRETVCGCTISALHPMMRTEKRSLLRLAEAQRVDHKGEKTE